ncbi:MAG TPA: major capsid protein [Candidatus Brocadiia bacterium]|nr:major capsid protein [Candidatus Brocadiia bacterium]
MPEPSQVHIDAALTNLSVGWQSSKESFVCDRVLPVVSVNKSSGKYFKRDTAGEVFMIEDGDLRVPGVEAKLVDWATSTDSYSCEEHSLDHLIPDEVRRNSDPAEKADEDGVDFIMEKLMRRKESACAAALTDSDLYASGHRATLSGSDQWSHSDSNPITAVRAAAAVIHKETGVEPNTLVLPKLVYNAVVDHPEVIERVKYVQQSTPKAIRAALADLFDVEHVLTPSALYATNARGQALATDYIWGKFALLCYSERSPGLLKRSIGYTFQWGQVPNGIKGFVVKKWREPARESDRVRISRYYDQKAVDLSCGFLWTAAVA